MKIDIINKSMKWVIFIILLQIYSCSDCNQNKKIINQGTPPQIPNLPFNDRDDEQQDGPKEEEQVAPIHNEIFNMIVDYTRQNQYNPFTCEMLDCTIKDYLDKHPQSNKAEVLNAITWVFAFHLYELSKNYDFQFGNTLASSFTSLGYIVCLHEFEEKQIEIFIKKYDLQGIIDNVEKLKQQKRSCEHGLITFDYNRFKGNKIVKEMKEIQKSDFYLAVNIKPDYRGNCTTTRDIVSHNNITYQQGYEFYLCLLEPVILHCKNIDTYYYFKTEKDFIDFLDKTTWNKEKVAFVVK